MKTPEITPDKSTMIFLFLAYCLLSSGPFGANSSFLLQAADCTTNSDACSSGAKKLSLFEAASMAENTASQPAPAPVKKSAASGKAPAAIPAPSLSTAAAPAPASFPYEPGGKLSSPAWLLLVIAGFAGLYFYLRGGARKRKRK